MDIDHIFFDLDGTLIGSAGDVQPQIWDAIEALRPRIGMSVCTGRPGAGIAARIAERMAVDGLHIFLAGAAIRSGNGELVSHTALERDDVDTLVAASVDAPAVLELYTPAGIFVSRNDDDCREHARVLGIEVLQADLAQVADDQPVLKAHWIGRPATFDRVLAIPLRFAEVGAATSPVLPQQIFASITSAATSKGIAAADVCARVGTTLDRCAAIGDSAGDLPLLDVVGHPFVVANTPADIRSRFQVLGHVDEDGVLPLLCALGAS